MKKLIYLISLLGLLACNKNSVPIDYTVGLHYKGSVWVEYNGESYENKDIEVNFTLSEDGKSADIRINNIRFVPQMPVTVTTVLPVKVSGSGNSYTFSAHGVYPHSPAGVEQQKYLINNLSGMVTGNMLSFSLFFGDYPTRFTGVACSKVPVNVKNPITISSPSPTEQITKVELSDAQKGYVQAGNSMAFRFLKQLYQGKNLICSPLSLQYALAMTANGASGETLQEIIDFLGYGDEGIDALNAYSKILLEQLPAVDLDVTLKVTDALLVNDEFPLLPSFKQAVEETYYAAVDNMDFSDPAQVAARINEWAGRNTNGFIDKVLEADEISADAVAFLMNALYFKAKWAGSDYDPMFLERGTAEEDFTFANGTKKKVKMMRNMRYHRYAPMDGFTVLALPYANGKFNMYVLLPDENNLEALLEKLQSTSWEAIQQSFRQDAEVYVRLPKFDIENKFNLNEALKAMGVKRAFQSGPAQFDRMFAPKEEEYYYWIGKVIQKARISVAEWGTEAAAVTVVGMAGATEAGPGEEPKRVYFYADHPFVFAIGESTSGTILFEGVYSGE